MTKKSQKESAEEIVEELKRIGFSFAEKVIREYELKLYQCKWYEFSKKNHLRKELRKCIKYRNNLN